MPETKVCDNCDAEIGSSETKCPKCGEDFSELEELVTAVEKARRISEKRAAKNAPLPTPPAPAPAAEKKESKTRKILGLGKVIKRA